MTLPSTEPQAIPAPASAQPAPEPTPAQPAASPEQPAEQPQYVTKKDLDQFATEIVSRVKQSDRDRTRNVETQLKGITEMLTKANVAITPEMQAALRGEIESRVDGETQATPEQPGPQQPQGLGPGHPVFDATMEIYETEKLDVKATDPEFRNIQTALDDPNGSMVKYIMAVQKAVSEKRERLELQKDTADARTLGGGEARPSSKPLTPEEKISKGLSSGQWQSQEPPKRQ
jgi:hypothetical protein